MPVVDLKEARDVSQVIERLLSANSFPVSVQHLRQLFVEKLDFSPASGPVRLHHDALPPDATRVAQRDGVQVVALQLSAGVRAVDLRASLQQLRHALAGDILLVAADGTRSQWHIVYPADRAGRETLRRMVLHRGQPRR